MNKSQVQIKKTIDGKRKSFYGKTKKDAERKYQEFLRNMDQQQKKFPNITFENWANIWLKNYKYGAVRDVSYYNTYETFTNS